jgi:hypothetical protein
VAIVIVAALLGAGVGTEAFNLDASFLTFSNISPTD